MQKQQYRPEIDGLRALAIIPVVVFHFFPEILPNGFLGVDVFFVISGFLITGILLRSFDENTFSFRSFWGRRIRRLFPVLAVMIIAGMISGYFTLYGDEWRALALQSLATLVSSANLLFWRLAGDYWGQSAESAPLLHMWSLAVEEQFYILYPIALYLIHKNLRRSTCTGILLTATLLSYLLMLILNTTHRAAAFYLLPTRSWELLAGCVIATLAHHRPVDAAGLNSNKRKLTAALGLMMICMAYWLPKSGGLSMPHATIAVVGSALFLHVMTLSNSCVFRPLAVKPLVQIGKVSYSWYVWHWPILVLCPKVILLPSQVLLVISLALGVVSWYLIENRTRFLPTATFVGTAVTLLIGCIASVSLPWLIVRPVLTYQIPENSLKINIQPPYVGKFQQYTGDYRTGLTIGPPAPHGRHSTLLLGDSHAVMYFPAILDICLQEGCVLTSFAADGGTWPFFVAEGALPANYYHSEASPDGWTPERRLAFDDARRNFIRSTSPSVIFVCGRWSHYYSELGPKSFERHMIDLLDELPATSVVVIPGQPPTLPFGSSGLSSGKLEIPPYRAFSEDPMEREKRQSAHSVIEKIARQDSRIRFVPVDAEFLGSQGIKFLQDGLILYRDDDHLNISGAKKCKARLQSAMVTAE